MRMIRRRFRTVQDLVVLLLMFVGMGWIAAGWWAYASRSFEQAAMLMPYAWLGAACTSLGQAVSDWVYYRSALSSRIGTIYAASLVGMVVVAIASLAQASDLMGLAGGTLALAHAIAWLALSGRRRRWAATN